MANPLTGQVAFELGDLTLTLEYSIDALCQLEARLKQPATDVIDRLQTDRTMAFKRSMLWAGLREHHPEYSEKQAGELLRRPGASSVNAKILEAFLAAWPEPEPTEDANASGDPPNGAAAGTGPVS